MSKEDELQLEYAAAPGAYDEPWAAPGQPRAHWATLTRDLRSLGRRELSRRWQGALRRIREHGVSYNVYGDPRGLHRPWELDPFPLVLAADEWEQLEAGLEQRARLLAAILADLYGPQNLLTRGLFPPELVFQNPGYLRPCCGISLPEGTWLELYAADLARSPRGDWWVLADRTQAPSGMGYALENRIVLSRALPEAFRESQIERLAGFFGQMLATLHRRAPRRTDRPRIALLTPGPWNETYFEHAYLARYLGVTLVEGADLTVRERALYLKTLSGLERIDVLLRRVDDLFCDPLSLRSDSSLGVAGLVHAVRAGNLSVANALGSGMVETPALAAFLPGLCRELLGEELRIPSVATWWCGHEDALRYAIEHLDSLVIKPTFWNAGREPVFGGQLARAERQALIAELRAMPSSFVAQEQVRLSTAPVWNGRAADPRHVSLRAYAVTGAEGSWSVMPGGLTRVSRDPDSLVVSMQRGGGSKDTWITRREVQPPTTPVTLLRPDGSAPALTRGGAALASRVADELFWLGRYSERIEGAARAARSVLARLSGERAVSRQEVEPLLQVLVEHGGLSPTALVPDSDLEAPLLDFLLDRDGESPLHGALSHVHQLAFSLRDQISLDTWRVLSNLGSGLSEPAAPDLDGARSALNEVITQLAAWCGLSSESMTRTLGWRFTQMGRRLERASYTSSLVAAALVTRVGEEAGMLDALLESVESVISYRRRYRDELSALPALDLLLTDGTNPRSVVFQLARLVEHVQALPHDVDQVRPWPDERIAMTALSRLELAEVRALGVRQNGKRLELENLLAQTSGDLAALSDNLSRTYLAHAGESRRTERY